MRHIDLITLFTVIIITLTAVMDVQFTPTCSLKLQFTPHA